MLKIIEAPKRTQLQFMLTRVGSRAVGKKLKNIVIAVYASPITLTNGPKIGPMCQGPQRRLSFIGSLRSRLWRRSDIGIIYDEKNAATFTDIMALNADVLPMLMSARRSDMMVLTRME